MNRRHGGHCSLLPNWESNDGYLSELLTISSLLLLRTLYYLREDLPTGWSCVAFLLHNFTLSHTPLEVLDDDCLRWDM